MQSRPVSVKLSEFDDLSFGRDDGHLIVCCPTVQEDERFLQFSEEESV